LILSIPIKKTSAPTIPKLNPKTKNKGREGKGRGLNGRVKQTDITPPLPSQSSSSYSTSKPDE
jgi:hypothetical protein